MARPSIDYQKAAQALVDAHFSTDNEAAVKHGVTRQTILNYRKRLTTDEEFLQVYTSLMESVRDTPEWDWVTDGLRSAMKAALECFDKLERRSPESLRVIRETIETLASYEQTKRVIDAELATATGRDTPYAATGAQGTATVRAYA